MKIRGGPTKRDWGRVWRSSLEDCVFFDKNKEAQQGLELREASQDRGINVEIGLQFMSDKNNAAS